MQENHSPQKHTLKSLSTLQNIKKFLNNQNNINNELYKTAEYALNYIYNSPNFDKINKIISTYNITPMELASNIINNFTINIDYDDVLVDLIGGWLEWIHLTYSNEPNYKQIKREDLTEFYVLEKLQEQFDIYPNNKIHINGFFFENEGYKKYVNVLPESKIFMDKLKEFNFKKYYIVTATYCPENVPFKHKHIKENFNIDSHKIIFSPDKSNININFGTHIDDATHNVEGIVQANPYCFIFLIDKLHNQKCEVGKRILRLSDKINYFEEIFNSIPLIAAKNIERLINKPYLEEQFNIKINVNDKKTCVAQQKGNRL